MTRKIERRLIIEGQLYCHSPVHVSGWEGRADVDLALSINGDGEFYIPGTSIAGPMRSWCEDNFRDMKPDALWGPRSEEDEGHASLVTIEDAIVPDKALTAEIRDGVGINRFTGAAADRNKFNREVLPPGTTLSLSLIFDQQKEDADGPRMLASLIQSLMNQEIRFGAAKSRGFGKVELRALEVSEQNTASKDGILDLLREKTASYKGDEALSTICKAWKAWRRSPAEIGIRIFGEPVGPLMVKASAAGMVVDMLPLAGQYRGERRFVLPGSSSKGTFRAHAERIATTLFDGALSERNKLLEQLTRYPLIETLFGTRNDADDQDRDDDDRVVGLSALGVEDCCSKTPVSEKTWQHMLGSWNGDEQSDKELDELSAWTEALPEYRKRNQAPYLDPAVHVAIDRWSGGASDGALFSVLEPWGFEWSSLDLTLDPVRLARHGKDLCGNDTIAALAAISLLLLTLRDFVNGEIPLGFATNRGFGSVAVSSIDVSVPRPQEHFHPFANELLSILQPLDGALIADGTFNIDSNLKQSLEKAWWDYLASYEFGAGTHAEKV